MIEFVTDDKKPMRRKSPGKKPIDYVAFYQAHHARIARLDELESAVLHRVYLLDRDRATTEEKAAADAAEICELRKDCARLSKENKRLSRENAELIGVDEKAQQRIVKFLKRLCDSGLDGFCDDVLPFIGAKAYASANSAVRHSARCELDFAIHGMSKRKVDR